MVSDDVAFLNGRLRAQPIGRCAAPFQRSLLRRPCSPSARIRPVPNGSGACQGCSCEEASTRYALCMFGAHRSLPCSRVVQGGAPALRRFRGCILGSPVGKLSSPSVGNFWVTPGRKLLTPVNQMECFGYNTGMLRSREQNGEGVAPPKAGLFSFAQGLALALLTLSSWSLNVHLFPLYDTQRFLHSRAVYVSERRRAGGCRRRVGASSACVAQAGAHGHCDLRSCGEGRCSCGRVIGWDRWASCWQAPAWYPLPRVRARSWWA